MRISSVFFGPVYWQWLSVSIEAITRRKVTHFFSTQKWMRSSDLWKQRKQWPEVDFVKWIRGAVGFAVYLCTNFPPRKATKCRCLFWSHFVEGCDWPWVTSVPDQKPSRLWKQKQKSVCDCFCWKQNSNLRRKPLFNFYSTAGFTPAEKCLK